MAVAFVLLGVIKRSGLLKYGRSAKPDFSLFLLLREYYTLHLWHLFIPIGLALLFSCTYATVTGNVHFVIPIFSIGIGLLYNCIATLLRLDDFLWSGYWFLAAGCVFMVFNTVPLLLSTAIVFGFGFLLMAAIMYMPHNKRAEE